ncbi:MAG: gamma carbonic anhydrase family protein [Helicobacteraceae bacterium]|jgi:carbonic anhydrase/acetyltransferase-like protein (isoleucine patch superfamily)|nr:gamma carbonic anhydrase family protein [Helicobacteraceae bacterium]
MALKKFKGWKPQIGERVFIAPSADLIGRCEIGADSSIWFGAVIRADVHKVKIGARVSVQDGAVIHVTHSEKEDESGGFPTIVGDDVTIGHRAVLHGCVVENACLIGMGAIILDGAVIGAESIIGAGALVTQGKVFPPRSLILGSPAKVVRSLNDGEIAELYASASRYTELKDKYLSGEKEGWSE